MTPRSLAVVIGLLASACGDNSRGGDDVFTPVSGTRLALQKYRYEDGTELAVAGEFYDTQLHTRCTAEAWPDGSLRCIPVADDAEYVDPACTTLAGIGRTIARPTHFVAADTLASGAPATRVFRAGAARAPIAQYYSVVRGLCVGPTAVPQVPTSFFEVGDELDGDALVAFHDDEIGDDRLGLRVRATDDGLRVAAGLRDRTLDVACLPTLQGDGRIVCEPGGAAPPIFFGDPACSQPVVAAQPALPAIAALIEPSGCASYHRVGPEVPRPVYRRDGDTCAPVAVPVDGRWFALEAPLALPVLARSLEEVAGRRLQRVILDHDGLRLFDDRLFDTAAGVDCRPRTLRDAIRCLPASTIAATTLFLEGCTTQVRVAEVPRQMCERLAYATANRPFQLRTIGDPVSSTLFRLDGTACQPYTAAPGNELRDLGPALDLTTFLTAIYFGERSP